MHLESFKNINRIFEESYNIVSCTEENKLIGYEYPENLKHRFNFLKNALLDFEESYMNLRLELFKCNKAMIVENKKNYEGRAA